ncbi:peptidase M28-like protein [Pseudoduganella flava]|uniref:M20/M25/M40 family metallo-hydrolase n=1 Tax=Pseudoduganella flava TaxID=871742 RepID=A0A562Q080_9BURK|nr:M28 family peptidase [Pseudoduganella flava]QGZ38584.1 M20/M25/M40 family metallo-hydrolase [Pseudoduganella flava]TWI49850.1 peptidase M28-like protein [Pseudoduganella flava]
MRHLLSALTLAVVSATALAQQPDDGIAGRITADSLRGHLSFLASDLLEGRGTPSRGQDLAAEYIAAQFRRAGLQPAGDDGYFQTANWQYGERAAKDFTFTVQAGGKTIGVPLSAAAANFVQPLALAATQAVFMPWKEALADSTQANGKVLVVPAAPVPGAAQALRSQLKSKPALVVMIDKGGHHGNHGAGWLIDPEQAGPADAPPVVIVHAADAAAALEQRGATVAATIGAPSLRAVKLRNVIGVLRGADPELKNTYVMLTAHYDHLGVRDGAIHNGANDDGSGTVSVIEIAAALAAEKQRPRRSIVFMALFGEELGMLGSRYYGRHPVFPVKDTVADLNLEQVGRTDDSEGAQVNSATVTGYDYSTVTDALKKAGERTGIRLWKHPVNSDRYFAFSDNQSLADLGVPAHTLAVAFAFPDYHGKDDDWGKVDYDNMARINRMVALALRDIANDPVRPKWTDAPSAAPYATAARKLQAQ